MITKEELNDIKKVRRTNLYYTEKEYLQYIFLNSISRYPDEFIFKGGTCLRICYGLERASEDLDFSSSLDVKNAKKIVLSCLKDFSLLNIPYKVYSEKKFMGNVRFEIRFEGPLYSGSQNSTNTLKIDLNNQRPKNTQAKVVEKMFSDVPQFVINVLAEKEILAEKIRALIKRSEPRDLYDLWVLFSKNIEIDKPLIKQKLKEEKVCYEDLRYPSENEYKTLMDLVSFLPNYSQVLKEVSEKIKNIFRNI